MNCKLHFWILVLCSLNVVWLLLTLKKKFMHSMIRVTDVYLRDKINMIFISNCLGLLKILRLGFTQTPYM